MKSTVFIATSLDGFIAREDGAIDWLPTGDATGDDEDYGYRAFIETVDALVMGRHTYELVRSFAEWPYGKMRVVVLSRRGVEIPADLADRVETMSGSPAEVVVRLAERGMKHLYVDGGLTIQRFLADGLITRMIITRVPIVIGRGIPLFGPTSHDIRLRHIRTTAFPSGLVQGEYETSYEL